MHIVEDAGVREPDNLYEMTDTELEEYFARSEAVMDQLPPGVGMAILYQSPFVPETRIEGWKAVGGVSGGMGGGGLLDGDMWIHYEFLFRGLGYVNGIRRLLGLPVLEKLDVVMKESQRQHAAMFTAALG